MIEILGFIWMIIGWLILWGGLGFCMGHIVYDYLGKYFYRFFIEGMKENENLPR